MNTLDIICDSCGTRMRLSDGILSRVKGKTGRVSCKRCEQKVTLDGRGDDIAVLSGGKVIDDFALERVPGATPPILTDPHLSVIPPAAEEEPPFLDDAAVESVPSARVKSALSTRPRLAPRETSIAPPFPEEVKRSRAAKLASQKEPGLRELADQIRSVIDRPAFEAPVPGLGLRGQEDSLSPHAFDDDEEGLVSVHQEFRSSPFSSERDETYRSLFPQTTKTKDPAIFEAPDPHFGGSSKGEKKPSRASRKNEANLFDADLSKPAGQLQVMMAPDGTLINKTDQKAMAKEARARRTGWIPWSVAAVALLGLGVSVGMQVLGKPMFKPGGPSLTNVTSTSANPSVAHNTAEEAPAEQVEAGAPPSSAPALSTEKTSTSSGAPLPAAASPSDKSMGKPSLEPKIGESQTDAKQSETIADPDEPRMPTASAIATAQRADSSERSDAPAPPFSASAASAALREATALAQGCRSPADPSGVATVTVTFAPSGRVTQSAVTGAPYAGTTTGGCIAARFRSARVPEFTGDFVTVRKTVTIN